MRQAALPHVVIVGGGFAGLHAARGFHEKPVRVTLVDRRNHHLFQPLLYQVATASLSPADIASPIRSILRREENVRVILGDVTAIDPAAKAIVLDGVRIAYDYLILAAGAQHSYFGHDEWEEVAPGLKSLEDALEIRRRILLAYEAAERTSDEQARIRLLTFVVVGGGPTGVELAGALAEISRYSLARDFDNIDPTEARIYLVEAAPRILGGFPEKLSKKAAGYLQKLGVTVRTETMVTAIDADGVELAGSERIAAGTVLWAAGVKAAPVAATLGVPLDRAGRVPVQPDLSVAEHPEIFVAGDLANLAGADGRPLPGVAQVAMQQGKCASANVLHRIAGEGTEAFHYKDLGNMATIGRNRAIADIGPVKIGGFVAWMAWLFIHILNLIGFRNRAIVMLHWVWSYFTFQRGARLITSTAKSQELI
ncbi:MAG: NAD(P)/FAD-dependent oxidoreductase [Thermomicrobiales bacterium]|nr:NAD(P)/FAD-dependent oxidoreductase [Thermomicrobiales bacterium]